MHPSIDYDHKVYRMQKWVFELKVGSSIIYQPTRATNLDDAEEAIKQDWPSAKIIDVFIQY